MSSIISGKLQGIKLNVPKKGTRPTSQRVKEAIFSTLDHYGIFDLSPENSQLLALDLYAGSGALGLEALSRGFDSCTFVDLSNDSIKCIKKVLNFEVKNLDLSLSKCVQSKVSSFLKEEKTRFFDCEISKQKYSLIFIDPPYDIDSNIISDNLADCVELIKTESIIVLERSSRSPVIDLPESLEIFNTKKYGETTIYYIQLVID